MHVSQLIAMKHSQWNLIAALSITFYRCNSKMTRWENHITSCMLWPVASLVSRLDMLKENIYGAQ